MKKSLLIAAFAAMIGASAAFAQDVTVSLPGDGNLAPSSGTTWTSSTSPAVTLTLNGGEFLNGGSTFTINTAAATRQLTIESADASYYVSGFSFDATGVQGDVVTISKGTYSVTTDGTVKPFSITNISEGSSVVLTLQPSVAEAKKAILSNFKVTLTPTGETPNPNPTPDPDPDPNPGLVETIVYTPVDKADWTISANSQETTGEPAPNGPASCMIDDNESTYWHTIWSIEPNPTCPHWFVIDLGKDTDFNVIEFVTRGSINGCPKDIDIYLSETDNFSTVRSENVLTYGTPTLSTTLSGTTNAHDKVELGEQTARYVMVVIKTSAGSSADTFACLAEVNLYNKSVEMVDPTPKPGDQIALDRSNWVITGCGQRGGAGDTDGGFSAMIDDNLSSYWHSEWSSDKTLPHFFVIDLGENHENYGAFGYQPRVGATTGNGYVTDYRLYCEDSVEGLEVCAAGSLGSFASDSHSSLETYLADKTPVSQGTFAIKFDDVATQTLQKVTFDATNSTTGRYVIFVIDGSSNNEDSHNPAKKHANCAEFYIYSVVPADYTTGLEDSKLAHTSRKTSSLTVSDGENEIKISDLQSGTGSAMAFDKTASVLTTKAGKTITITPEATGEWMHNYVYADWGKDGFLYSADSDYLDGTTLKSGVDLVAFSHYSADDSTWKNSKGETLNDGRGLLNSAISFTIPSDIANGTYRVRYKVDWNNLDPKGCTASNNHIANNGGIIVDFTLVIDGSVPETPTYESSVEFVTEESDMGLPNAITAIEITVPENARPTGAGSLNLGYVVYDYTTGEFDFDTYVNRALTADDLTLVEPGKYSVNLDAPLTHPGNSSTVLWVICTCDDEFFATYASEDATEPNGIVKGFDESTYVYYNYTIGDGDFKIGTTPADGVVEGLTTISFTFPDDSEWVEVNTGCDGVVTLSKGEEVVKSWTAGQLYNAYNEDNYQYELTVKDLAGGNYTLHVPAEMFYGSLGYSLEHTAQWTVVAVSAYTPELMVEGADADGVAPAIAKLTLTAGEGAEMAVAGEITIKLNNSEVVATATAEAVALNAETGLVEVTLTEPIEEAGFYTISVPEHFLSFTSETGVNYSAAVEATVQVVPVEKPADPVALTITPLAGEIGMVADITFSFDHEDGYKLDVVIPEPAATLWAVTLTRGTESLLTLNREAMAEYAGTYDDEGMPVAYFVIPAYEFAGVGTYTLTLPEGFFFVPDLNAYNQAATVTWTVTGTGLTDVTVTVDGTDTRYDLQGRRAAKNARGVIIVNGEKTLVK